MNLKKFLEYVYAYSAVELWDSSNGYETIINVKNKTEIPTKYLNCKIESNSILANINCIIITIITE